MAEEHFSNGDTYRRQIVIELPLREAAVILQHRFIYFNSGNCVVSLNSIISDNDIGIDHSSEQKFIEYLEKSYGENREEMMKYHNIKKIATNKSPSPIKPRDKKEDEFEPEKKKICIEDKTPTKSELMTLIEKT